jgi:acetyl esterase/lipase
MAQCKHYGWRGMTTSALLLTALTLARVSHVNADIAVADARQPAAGAQADGAPTQANVIYGMYSGLALLMDVYLPSSSSNGRGVLLIPGSAWRAPLELSAKPLKSDTATVQSTIARLRESGYAVFVINHRSAPRFHHPEALEDVRRAVRFIRHHAADYRIDAAKLSGLGFSSGAHLVMLLATQPDEAAPASTSASTSASASASASGAASASASAPAAGRGKPDPLAIGSTRLQCVVAGAAPVDLTHPGSPTAAQLLTDYIGAPVTPEVAPESDTMKRLAEASPITYATADDPPTLFVHGVKDPLVPIDTVRAMAARLTALGVRTQLLDVPAGSHWPLDKGGSPDLAATAVSWFDSCFTAPASR